MAKERQTPENCLNCGERIVGKFCPACGQKNTDYRESIWHVIAEVLEEAISFDSRLYRSVYLLLLKPGRLTREYNEGKRTKYLRPLRMYIFCSISYFFLFSFSGPEINLGGLELDVGEKDEAAGETGGEIADSARVSGVAPDTLRGEPVSEKAPAAGSDDELPARITDSDIPIMKVITDSLRAEFPDSGHRARLSAGL